MDHTYTLLCDEGLDPQSKSGHPPRSRPPSAPDSPPRLHPPWDHKMEARIEETKQAVDGTCALIFEHPSEATGFYIVIGCDGAWSKIHSFVSETKPHHPRISAAEVRHRDVSNPLPPSLPLWVPVPPLFQTPLRSTDGDASIRIYTMFPTDNFGSQPVVPTTRT